MWIIIILFLCLGIYLLVSTLWSGFEKMVGISTITTSTSTPNPQSCTYFAQISTSMLGEEVCVYGIIQKLSSSEKIATIIKFRSIPTCFYLIDTEFIYPDLAVDDCVMAKEEIRIVTKKVFLIWKLTSCTNVNRGCIKYVSMNNWVGLISWN